MDFTNYVPTDNDNPLLTARKNFMIPYNGDTLLTETIPSIANELLDGEFGVNYKNIPDAVPITFVVAWTKILQFMDAQPDREYALNIGGLRIAYKTDYHEGDKSSNIVPILQHVKKPVFVKQQATDTIGSDFTKETLQKYNSWRSVNLEEVVSKIDNDTHAEVLNTSGIDLGFPVAVFPILAAVYAAALQIAVEAEGEKLNLYNVFQIKYNQGNYFIKELALIKQNLKGDGKNNTMNG